MHIQDIRFPKYLHELTTIYYNCPSFTFPRSLNSYLAQKILELGRYVICYKTKLLDCDRNRYKPRYLMDYLYAYKRTSLLSDRATHEEKMFENLYFLVAKLSGIKILQYHKSINMYYVYNSFKTINVGLGKVLRNIFHGMKALVIRK